MSTLPSHYIQYQRVTDFVIGEFYYSACKVENIFLCIGERQIVDGPHYNRGHFILFLHDGQKRRMYLSDARNQLWSKR